MKVSRRLSSLLPDGDDGWHIHYRAQAMKRAGQPVTLLTVGESDAPTPAPILAAMDRAARAGATGYTEISGLPELREHVAMRVEARTGVATRAANVLIMPGAQAALWGAHMAVLDPGETALFPDPYYATYPGTVRSVGGVPRVLPTRAEESFLPSAAALAEAAPGARSLLINTPNNPTGQIYDRLTLARIAAACIEHDLWLISDEVYESQVWSGAHVSPRELPGMVERTLVLGSMSKSHAMTGSRIGWLIGPEAVIAAVSDLCTNTTYGLPGYIQRAALWALQQGDELEAEVSAPFRRRRRMAEDLLSGAEGLRLLPSAGAMYGMIDVRPTGMTGIRFASELLEAEAIAVMPGESFGHAAAGHVRVALTINDTDLSYALQRIAGFARSRMLARTG